MHQNSFLYTNDNINSNKENIPPIRQYQMPSNTQSAKWQALNHTPLQEISTSPDPNDIVITTSSEPTPELTTKALIKRTGNCPLCRLPYVYNHIALCQGLTNGYTCHCHKETLAQEQTPSKTDTTTIETPLYPTTVQKLDEFYPDKDSYLSFQTKFIHKPSFTTFDYVYHFHWSLKHQIQMTEELLFSLQTIDETHITAVEAALLRMCKRPLGDKISSKTSTTYLHDALPLQKQRDTYPQRKVSFLTPQETGSSTSYRSQQNLIIVDSPPTSPKQQSTPFPQNTCFKYQSSQHAVIHCPSYKCWQCNWTAPGHYQNKCLENPKNQPHVFKNCDDYNNYISADADYNLSGECWIIHQLITNNPMPHPLLISTSFSKIFLIKLCLPSLSWLLILLLSLSNPSESILSTTSQEEIFIFSLRLSNSVSTNIPLNENLSTSELFSKLLPQLDLHLIFPSTSLTWSILMSSNCSLALCTTQSTTSMTCLWDSGLMCNPMQAFGSSQKCMP